jgi:hypothetical protein
MSLIGEGLELLGLLDKARNAELYKQLGDYIEKVRTLQIENDSLSEKVREYERQLKFKGTLERVNGHTFIQNDDEEICPCCAESDLKPIHLIPHRSKYPPYQKAWCPKCQTEFNHNVPYSRALASQINRPGHQVL